MNWQTFQFCVVLAGFGLLTGAKPLLGVDTSDWDWGSVEEMPTTPEEVKTPHPPVVSSPSLHPPIAAPDLNAVPKSAESLFANMPALEVVPSIRDPALHPCSNCHQWTQSNPTPRVLGAPHDNFALQHGLHGRGKFWCFTCHDFSAQENKGSLRTLEGVPLGYDEAYVLCIQCHVHKGRDWAFGAHGKRLGTWQGSQPRRVYTCTACHYQHAPVRQPRMATDGPAIRQGLPRPPHWIAKSHLRLIDSQLTKVPWEQIITKETRGLSHE